MKGEPTETSYFQNIASHLHGAEKQITTAQSGERFLEDPPNHLRMKPSNDSHPSDNEMNSSLSNLLQPVFAPKNSSVTHIPGVNDPLPPKRNCEDARFSPPLSLRTISELEQYNSYWSEPEKSNRDMLALFGLDFEGVSDFMRTKSTDMVRCYDQLASLLFPLSWVDHSSHVDQNWSETTSISPSD